MLPFFLLLMLVSFAYAQTPDTLARDRSEPFYVFRYPDAFGNDLRNQRFAVQESGQLVGALFCFGGREGQFTTGSPQPTIHVWGTTAEGLPDPQVELAVLYLTSPVVSYFHLDSSWENSNVPWFQVDLTSEDLRFNAGQEFHLGYSLQSPSPSDSLAILADRGSPETSFASEWRDGRFRFLAESWRGCNLFIRAMYVRDSSLGSPEVVIPSSIALRAYPNPFNSFTRIEWQGATAIDGELRLIDITGRLVGNWRVSPNQSSTLIDASRLATGRYYLSLVLHDDLVSMPLILLK